MTPSTTESAARRVLTALEQYKDRWSQKWSTPKFKMLCLNVRKPLAQWPFKDSWFDTMETSKYGVPRVCTSTLVAGGKATLAKKGLRR